MKTLVLSLLLLTSSNLLAQQPWSLPQCIKRAYERNIDLKKSDIARQQAALQLQSAKAARQPELSVSAGENLSFGRGLTANNTYVQRTTSSTSLNLGGSLPLYTGGRLKAQQERAHLLLAAATADVELLRENLALQIAQLYLQCLYNADLVEQNQASLQEAQKQEQRIAQLIQAGKTPEVEFTEAKARVAQDKLALTQAINNQKLALLELSQALEMGHPDSLQLQRPNEQELPQITGNPEEIYLLALNDRPALKAIQLRIEATQQSIALAKAGKRPSLTATAGIGTSYYATSGLPNANLGSQLKDNFGQQIGLSLNFPLLDRGATRHGVRSAQLERLNQQLSLEEQQKRLYKDIQNAYYNALAAEQKHRSSLQAEEATQTALEAVVKKHEVGRATATEYDQARLKHFTATSNRIAARYELLLRAKILDFYRGHPIE